MTRGLGWPIGIGAILLLTVGGNLAVYRIANDDPAFAIEPDYYRKAVSWDSTLARRAESAALGWTITPQLTARGATGTLVATATDGAGAPLTQATVRAELFAVARSQHPDTVTLREVAPGQYTATVPNARRGQWEVRLSAARDGHRWAAVQRLDVP